MPHANATASSRQTSSQRAPSSGQQLKSLLPEILGSRPDPVAIGEFAALAHRMASAYLGKKAKGGHLNPGFFGLSLEDLAFDCIAPLFERNAQGELCQLQAYFETAQAPPEALLARLRRLVFSAVEQELFAHYGQMDPGLSKLIRNIKRAAKARESLSLERPDGELWIYLCAAPDQHQPLIPSELLERRITAYLEENITAPRLLEVLETIFQDLALYRQAVPVTLLAQAARAGLKQLKDERAANPRNEFRPGRLQAGEIREMIRAAVQATEEAKYASYVESAKLSERCYRAYFRAVEAILTDRFLEESKTESFYEHLSDELPITSEAYHEQHRTRLEYLVQLAREELLALAKEEI